MLKEVSSSKHYIPCFLKNWSYFSGITYYKPTSQFRGEPPGGILQRNALVICSSLKCSSYLFVQVLNSIFVYFPGMKRNGPNLSYTWLHGRILRNWVPYIIDLLGKNQFIIRYWMCYLWWPWFSQGLMVLFLLNQV